MARQALSPALSQWEREMQSRFPFALPMREGDEVHYTQVSLVCGSASSNPPLPAGEGKEGWV